MAFRKPSPQPEIFDGLFAHVPANQTLRAIQNLVDWAALRTLLAESYDSSGVGIPGYDPVLLAKLLLLESIYSLSDIRVCEEAGDRLSFREFLGLSAGDTVPDSTTLVRFRKRLARHNLGRAIDDFFRAELARNGLGFRPGAITIIDASLIQSSTNPPVRVEPKPDQEKESESPSPKPTQKDTEATTTFKNGKWHHGHKVHVAHDAITDIIHRFHVTTASVHDSQVFEVLLTGTEGTVIADRGYNSAKNREYLRKHEIADGIMQKAHRGESASTRKWKSAWNKIYSGTRSRIEKVFAVLKRWRGCGRARFIGVEKVERQLGWAIAAHNLLTMNRLLGRCL